MCRLPRTRHLFVIDRTRSRLASLPLLPSRLSTHSLPSLLQPASTPLRAEQLVEQFVRKSGPPSEDSEKVTSQEAFLEEIGRSTRIN